MKIIQDKTVKQSSRGGHKPCLIVWHIAEGTYHGTIGWGKNPQGDTSSHFVLGKNGEVTQLIPLDKAAWTQGVVKNPTHPYVKAHPDVNPNQYCISIECEGFWKDTKGKLTDKALDTAVELTKHIVSEVKRIYGVTIPIDREHIIGHCEINSVTRPHCPGELFPFDELISRASGKKPQNEPQNEQKTTYTIQVGAFKNVVNAASLKNKLSGMGYFCFTSSKTNDCKVCVGKFETKEQAQVTADDLKKKGYNGFVTEL